MRYVRAGGPGVRRDRTPNCVRHAEQLLARMAESALSDHQPKQAKAVLALVDACLAMGRGASGPVPWLQEAYAVAKDSLTRLFAKTGLRSQAELTAATVAGALLRATS